MVDYSSDISDYILDTYDTFFPAGSILQLRSGAPAGADNPAGGTLLVSITLPLTPWQPASGGTKSKNGDWSNIVSVAGTIGHYRLVNGSYIEEGTVTTSGGGGDMIVNTAAALIWRSVTVETFDKTL